MLTVPPPFESVPIRESLNAAPAIAPVTDESRRQVVPPPRSPLIRGDMPRLDPNEDTGIAAVQALRPPPLSDHEPSMKLTVLQRVMPASPESAVENSQPLPTAPVTPRQRAAGNGGSRSHPLPPPARLESVLAPPSREGAPISNPAHLAPAIAPHPTVESEEPRS